MKEDIRAMVYDTNFTIRKVISCDTDSDGTYRNALN